MNREQASEILANYLRHNQITLPPRPRPQSFADYTNSHFYIVNEEGARQRVTLLPHQIAILEYALDPTNEFTTIVYSTVKKSGKTAVAAMVARWIAETWGLLNEVYMIANDLEQAKGRAYRSLVQSIELDPAYERLRRILPDSTTAQPKWRVLDKETTHVPSGSIVRSLAGDYKGEAGSNPTATFWSELWGYTSENSQRMWDELTPVPTRRRSLRFVETYAGYEQESTLLWDLYELGRRKGTRIDLPGWPFDDPSPVYINRNAKLFMYWDTGIIARRMPWQTPDYYLEQAQSLRPAAFERLHLNLWTSSSESFMPIEWWDACYTPQLPTLPQNTPLVLAADAGVSHDSTALVGAQRHPTQRDIVLLDKAHVRQFFPPPNGTINYSNTIEPAIRYLTQHNNVVQVGYDPYQLHKLATDLRTEGIAWFRPFQQGIERLTADRQFFDMVRDRKIMHNGIGEIRDSILQANAKYSVDDDTRFRIIKKTKDSIIDPLVCASMAVKENLRLNL